MKKATPIIALAGAILGVSSYFVYGNYKRNKVISDNLERIHQRAADSVDAIYQKTRDSANNKLLSEKRQIIQVQKNRDAEYAASKEKNETPLLGREGMNKAKKTLRGSSFNIIRDCEARESFSVKGYEKIDLQINVCNEVKEFKYKVFNPNYGANVNKAQGWYMTLNMDLANIKYHSEGGQYFDIKNVIRGVVLGMNSDHTTNVDFMKPVIFEGGKLLMTRLESNGKNSTLEFTIYVDPR